MPMRDYVHQLDRYTTGWRAAIDTLGHAMRLPYEVSTFAPSGWAELHRWPLQLAASVRLVQAQVNRGQATCPQLQQAVQRLGHYVTTLQPPLRALRRERDRVPNPSTLQQVGPQVPGALQATYRAALDGLSGLRGALHTLLLAAEYANGRLHAVIRNLNDAIACGILNPQALDAGALQTLLDALE